MLCTSCEEEYVIDDVDFESSIVINSMFSDSKPWSVSVTNSKNILDNTQDIGTIEEAKVEMFNKAGRYLYDLYLDESGNFSNEELSPSQGQIYSIKVSSKGYKTAVAQDKVPIPGELTIDKVEVRDEYGEVISTELIFHIGKSDEETYLVWDLYKASEIAEEGGIPEVERSLVNVWINQLNTNPRLLIESRSSNVIKTFDGSVTTTLEKLVEIDDWNKGGGVIVANSDIKEANQADLIEHITFGGDDDDSGEGGGNDEEDKADSYELRVMTISKELHDYYFSLENFFAVNPNSNTIPPSKVYSNVKNGYGMFASYNEQVIRF